MNAKHSKSFQGGWLENLALMVTKWTGTSMAFSLALLVVIVWIVTGPVFSYSDTWQLVINTGTTIVTFLMVFLIQRAQNKDSMAINAKLNEIIASQKGASNRLINAEDLSEDEMCQIHQYYCKLVELAKKDSQITDSHSLEEARERHEEKLKEQ